MDRGAAYWVGVVGRTSRAAGILAAGVGAVALAGWALDEPAMRGLFVSSRSMKCSSAAALLLAGSSLALQTGPRAARRLRLGRGLAAACAALGLLTIVQYALGLNLGFDSLRPEPVVPPGPFPPGRMALTTAFCFLALGVSLLAVDRDLPNGVRPAEAGAAAAGVVSLASAIGSLYGVNALFGIAVYTETSPHTALSLLLLAFGVFFARPGRGLALVVTGDGAAPEMVRRLLPAAALIPVALGGLFVAGSRGALFDTGLGIALLTTLTIVAAIATILIAAVPVQRMEGERRKAREEIERANLRLKSANVELERSNRELEQFAFAASHDLKAPLRKMRNFVDLALENLRGADPAGLEYLRLISAGAARMQDLIEALLSYSSVGRSRRMFERVDLGGVLRAAQSNLDWIMHETGARVESGRLPDVLGDRPMLVSLFQNLIDNAVKFRAHDAPRIRVTAERAGCEWLITVSDNGIGVDPRHAGHIFRIFRRLHRADVPGTGIGLAICKKVAELHGGRIWVEAVEGGGSAFRVALPADDGAPAAAAPAQPAGAANR